MMLCTACIKEAAAELGIRLRREVKIEYSKRIKGYNASVVLYPQLIIFKFGHAWKGIDRDIQIGLVQHLLGRAFRKVKETPKICLYNSFIKNAWLSIGKKKQDAALLAIFKLLNEKYFNNEIDTPNLIWTENRRVLGSYDFNTDTIRISKRLANDCELLMYVLYHEMLHKLLGFSGRRHHSAEFNEALKRFPGWAELERKLKDL